MSTEALATFRAELRAWLAEHAPASLHHSVVTPFQGYWGGTTTGFRSEDERRWFEVCLARGWTAPAWPQAYGGGGMSPDEHRIWREELTALGMPLPLVGFGLTMIGPILLSYGTEAQKAVHLPAIVRGELRWCQGYSEPGAGSDLASLRTRAERDGDSWVVNGQKIWTSHADKADWIFCLVRTSDDGPKQVGITFLIFPMDLPGITVRPIELISGASPFCEVFFTDVRVPADHVIGTEGQGWKVAKALLEHERGMVGESVAAGGARPPELMGYTPRGHAAAVFGTTPDGRIADPIVEDEVHRFEIDEACLKLTIQRANDAVRTGGSPGPESSIFKIAGTELNQWRWTLAQRIAGLDGVGWEPDPYAVEQVAIARHALRSLANTIEGGTSEIQRNIIARHVLRMPKGA
ncbi:MAG: acyl-CoA dehydrogenase family protein [Alphaproteobacteria bacterium]|nr:acyl-CoA dehydrogenase family protein [Alphaproteobacteria bacterium]